MKRSFAIPGLFFLLITSLTGKVFSQTVRVGTSLPARATLEVHGAGGTGNTSGIFGGEGAGISLVRNWPVVGFNQYNDGTSRFMSAGYAANQYCNPNTGDFIIDMLGSGNANVATTTQARALVINNSGNVGIGTNATDASLYVIKGTNFDGSAVLGGSVYSSFFNYSTTEDIYIRPGLAGSHVYINDLAGGHIIMGAGVVSRIGINTMAPVVSMHVVQAANRGIVLTEPSQNNNHWEQTLESYGGGPQSAFAYYYNGQLKSYLRPTDGVLIVASDRRIKTNITPLPSVLEKILQLNPVTFETIYRNPGHKISYGFIAQEVQQLFPEMVTVSSYEVEKGVTIPDFHALSYNPFKMIAVKGVQEEEIIIQKQQDLQDEISRRLEVIEKKLQLIK
jgi:trimeric autotransporter adhesin